MENKKAIKTIIWKSEYYNKYFNTMKEKNLSELIEILENTLKSNLNVFNVENSNIKNIENLSHYEKYNLSNKLNYSESICILNYIIHCKIWNCEFDLDL